MDVVYVYCSCCGYEGHDEFVDYSRATPDSEWYICPSCGEETSNVDLED